jgi:hypothetical protein
MSNGFHEVRLPLRLSLGASGGPGRRTDIVALSNGGEPAMHAGPMPAAVTTWAPGCGAWMIFTG